jgi:hypothetical protein
LNDSNEAAFSPISAGPDRDPALAIPHPTRHALAVSIAPTELSGWWQGGQYNYPK